MGVFMIDYKEEVKRLISENYVAADSLSKEFEMTTETLVDNLRNILPAKAIDEHLVYEVLKEMKFEPKESRPLEFYWYFKRK